MTHTSRDGTTDSTAVFPAKARPPEPLITRAATVMSTRVLLTRGFIILVTTTHRVTPFGWDPGDPAIAMSTVIITTPRGTAGASIEVAAGSPEDGVPDTRAEAEAGVAAAGAARVEAVAVEEEAGPGVADPLRI